jgi:hypothetical protein
VLELRPLVHGFLHLAVPGVVARWGFPARWKRAWLVMVATVAVDLDHLLADPSYDPNRCSIGFHPLHTALPIAVYALLLLFPRTRLVGLGLLIHMALDGVDCVWMRCG